MTLNAVTWRCAREDETWWYLAAVEREDARRVSVRTTGCRNNDGVTTECPRTRDVVPHSTPAAIDALPEHEPPTVFQSNANLAKRGTQNGRRTVQ